MIKKLLLLMFLLIPLATAMQITPETQSIDVYSTSAKNAYVNITNNLNEDVYLVTLSTTNPDIYFLDNTFNMTINESKEIKMVIQTSSTYHETTQVNVVFFHKSDVTNTPTSETVIIDDLGYQPDYLSVFVGSTISWTNNDVITHSVSSDSFDQDIDSGLSWSYTFSQSGIFNYHDKFTSAYNGQIVVKDIVSEEYIHDPQEDKHFSIEITSHLVETELSIDTLGENSFEVEANDNLDSVLVIENIGDKTAEIVKLVSSPSWINFGLNELYIEVGKKKYIPYTITPLITNSEDTNKNYTIEIIAQGSNTQQINTSINVYVPYKESISINDTSSALFDQEFDDDFLLSLFNTICKAYPESPYCKPVEVEKVVYKSPYVNYNYTYEDIKDNDDRTNSIMGLIERFIKTSQTDTQTIKEQVQEARDFSSETDVKLNELIQETKDRKKTETAILVVIAVFLLLILCGGLGGISWYFFKNKVKVDKSLET